MGTLTFFEKARFHGTLFRQTTARKKVHAASPRHRKKPAEREREREKESGECKKS